MRNEYQKFTNLVFKGGGAKGCAYAGCVEVLESKGIYNNITQTAGTSAGAITAALLAVGAGSDGLLQSVKHTDFRNFVSDGWGVIGDVERFVQHYGIHSGSGFVFILKDYFKKFCGNAEITFAELEQLASEKPSQFKKLSVVASNVTTGRSQIFNATSTPDVPLWQAVRASMSIPLVFEPMQIKGNYYVDGGLAWNYPIDIFDKNLHQEVVDGVTPIRNQATLGFYLDAQNAINQPNKFVEHKVNIDSLPTFATGLIDFMYQSSNMRYIHPDDKARTVFVDDLGVSATDFSIPDNMVDDLINSGRNATEDYFSSLENQ